MVSRLISPILVGRAEALESVERSIDELVAGNPVHLLVSGEAGVGKSRLLDEMTELARGRGIMVLRGGCVDIGDGGVPFGPIVDILRGLVRSLDVEELALVVGRSGPELTRLYPGLAPNGVTTEAAPSGKGVQARLMEALLGLIQRLGASTPVLVVIDDLHWADAATREVIAFLLRNVSADLVAFALTVRSDELHRRHPALPWLVVLERTGGIERIDLTRLGLVETRMLITAILGSDPSPVLVERIYARSEGNPFFVEELLMSERDVERSGRLPPTLREILLARIAAAPENAQTVIGIAAVAGRRVPHDLLAAVVDQDEDALLDGLRAAVGQQLLVTDHDPLTGDGYAFRHALLQEAAYDDLLPGERLRSHRAYAEALSARAPGAGAQAAGYWAELAFHWSATRDDQRAFEASIRAADAAGRAYAFADEHRHLERALELWTRVEEPEATADRDRVDILEQAAQAAFLSGDERRRASLYREAIAAVDPAADPVRSSSLHASLAPALWETGDTMGATRAAETAAALIEAEPPSADSARIVAGYGRILMLIDRWEASREQCERAIAIARSVGARGAEGHALNSLGMDLTALGHGDDGVAALEEALAIATDLGDVDNIGRGYVNLGEAVYYLGDLERARTIIDEGVRAAEKLGTMSSWGGFALWNAIPIAIDQGRWRDADRLARQSLTSGYGTYADRYLLARWVALLVATGDEAAEARLDDLGRLLDGAPIETQFCGPYHAARAELELWRARPTEAFEYVRAGLAELPVSEWFWYNLRLIMVGAWVVGDLAEVARARRDRSAERLAAQAGDELDQALQPILTTGIPRQHGRTAAISAAEVATISAERIRARQGPSTDAWREASRRWIAIDRPYLIAYCGWREGEALLLMGDRTGAIAALTAAHGVAVGLGAHPLRSAIEAMAARGRVELTATAEAADASPARSAADPFGLTPREREVVGLVSLGRTNRQIATELFITENTAGVHVSNILGKMGVSSRTEAASVAVRLGLGPVATAVDDERPVA